MPKIPVLALTLGDPGGIGPEIIARTLAKHNNAKIRYFVFGTPEPFKLLAKKCGIRLPSKKNITFFDVSARAREISQDLTVRPGKVALSNAAVAYAALEAAAVAAMDRMVDGIVTAPINKTSMRFIEKNFLGHTEFLAQAAESKAFAMMFVSDRLKVTLATIHLPVKKVSAAIKKNLVLEKIKLTDLFLKKYFRMKKPKLGVCALNPHGRETGTEDEAEIRPAVRSAVKQNIAAYGPFSADQLFHDAYEGRFDAVISMYHDQGLAPFKMIAFRDGVNVTLGLPFVRTSPDHGTAFDIAYRGKANPASFLSALKLAEKLVR